MLKLKQITCDKSERIRAPLDTFLTYLRCINPAKQLNRSTQILEQEK